MKVNLIIAEHLNARVILVVVVCIVLGIVSFSPFYGYCLVDLSLTRNEA